MIGAVLLTAFAQAAAPVAPQFAPPQIREIASGIYLAPDSDYESQGPDGNSVLIDTREGFVVVDTGRHDWHTAALTDFAAARERPIAAIFNTHWHLDHASGNYRIKARFPNARLYASAAGVAARDSGLLAENYRLGLQRWENERDTLEPARRARLRDFLDVMENLSPDVVLDRRQRLRLGGRSIDVHVAPHAVTESDVWLYDRSTRTAVLGDLVTLPAPYLDTACPDGWRTAMDEVWATPFRLAVPGHGAPMSRAQFATYRDALNIYLDCVAGAAPVETCSAAWADAAAPLLGGDATLAVTYAEEYAVHLRENGGRSAECRAPR